MIASQQGSSNPPPVETNGSGGTAPADIAPAESNGSVAWPFTAAVQAPTYTSQVHAAFLLGWSVAELRGRIQVTVLDPSLAAIGLSGQSTAADNVPGQALSGGLGTAQTTMDDVFWLASSLRICFSRISLQQQQLLPNSTTVNTRYDPGPKSPPYLYPDPPADYADVGISACDAEGKPVLTSFALCEATRRALNCLVLLYLKPELNLLPNVLLAQKTALVQAVLGTTGAGESAHSAATPAAPLEATPDPAASAGPGQAEVQAAVSAVSRQALLFLEAWDVFLRESFLAAGLSALDEAKLVAYEAGVSMAGLSWNISANALPIELSEAARETPANTPGGSGAVALGVSPASQLLRGVWQRMFDDQNINRLQHQILVLGKGLDDDYAARFGQGLSMNDTAASRDPSLPSRSLQTVTRCLDYWQRSIQWLNDPTRSASDLTVQSLRQLRFALIEQTSVWQALVLGQEDLRSYRGGNVIQQILQEVITSFEEIATQQGIVDAAVGVGRELSLAVEEAAVPIKKAIGQIEQDARQEIVSALFGLWPLLLIVVAVGLLGVFAMVLAAAQHPGGWLDLANLPSVMATVFGGFGLWHIQRQRNASVATLDSRSVVAQNQVDDAISTLKSKAADSAPASGSSSQQPESLAGRMGRVFGTEAATVLKAFEDGYKQIQIDLADLGYAVAVAYPLVEYFVINPAFRTVRADYDFVIQILWDQTDRKAEVMRVAYAAFGPIGLFALAKTGQSGNANQNSQS